MRARKMLQICGKRNRFVHMDSFLHQVAVHYLDGGEISGKCFVFPNRRSLSFFRKELAGLVKGMPLVVPELLTINDFFLKCSGKSRADKVHLLLVLYECYRRLNPAAEPLDEFVFWGDVLLSDFDDVDKYLVNTDHIFANISDFKSIQDSYSYLEPEQLEAIRRFVNHFRGEAGLKVDLSSDSNFKARFLKIWDILGPLYRDFNRELDAKGLCYEGRYYRELAESGNSMADIAGGPFPGTEKFVFVGLNALSGSEKKVLGRLRDAGLAEFCWDYCSSMIKAPQNKSSFFMSSNVVEFPPSFEPDGVSSETEFEAVSVPSGVGQAKLLPGILAEIGNPGIETAIVIPDENMLSPVLNSIPEDITELNVTMGCPMTGSEFWSLMDGISSLKLRLREKDGEWYFYHRSVWQILSNGLFREILTEEGKTFVDALRKQGRYYIPASEFKSSDPLLKLVFRPLPDSIREIEGYQKKVVAAIALRLKDNKVYSRELDFARDYYLAVGRLSQYRLDIQPPTYYRLLKSLLACSSVPFLGEPLEGLQIMGPLETRALDFENVIILSANEGVFPRHSVSASFIPPELRKGFGLPTYEFQDAVWAYYFYRLIQRAKRVVMIYDSRTEVSISGEESRYIRQLEMDFGVPVKRRVASSPISTPEGNPSEPKTAEDIAALRAGHLSASALKNYLDCPVKFYYSSVKGLKNEDEVSETLDSAMFGTAFHKTMEALYKGRKTISAEYIRGLLDKGSDTIRTLVKKNILQQIKSIEISGRNLIYAEMIERYVRKVLERDLEHLADCGTDSFKVEGIELPVNFKISGFNFVGVIDRLDSFGEGSLRVVDYKTGAVKDDDVNINDANAEEVVGKLFDKDRSKRPTIAFQLYLYDVAVSEASRGRTVYNSIYRPAGLFGEKVKDYPVSEKFMELMAEAVKGILGGISDLSVPWKRTEDAGEFSPCGNCDFKTICGR